MNTPLQKVAFLDRDGALIFEPPDTQQIDSIEKLRILPGVTEGLKQLQAEGFKLVMVTNQNGLGGPQFPREGFDAAQNELLRQLKNEGIECKMLHKMQEKKKPNVKDYLSEKKIDMAINVPDNSKKIDSTGGAYLLRRATVDFNVPLITNLQIAKQFIDAIAKMNLEDIEIKSWDEYVK